MMIMMVLIILETVTINFDGKNCGWNDGGCDDIANNGGAVVV